MSRRATVVHVLTVPMSLIFLRGQVAYMRERGIDTAVICSPGPELDAFASSERVPVHGVAMRRSITPVRDLASLLRIWLILRRLRPDVVHAHTPKGGLLGMLGATLARTRGRIYHMRGLPLHGATGARRALLTWTERISCRLAHRVVCVSASLREAALAESLVASDRIVVPHHGSGQGVDARGRFDPAALPAGTRAATRRKFGIPEDAVVVGFVGRLVRDKGICELAQAWGVLRGEVPGLHMLIVGMPESQDPLPVRVMKTLQEDARVHLAGEDWNTAPLYAAMDLVVLPSYREGFPNVPLEAGAMALPVIATRVPGCQDAVQEGVTGALVEPRDGAGLTDAIRTYVTDSGMRACHGRNARARVLRDFQPEAVWEATRQEYLRLLET
jgi:glycosyltransferase involved in cell wall biosynthesis